MAFWCNGKSGLCHDNERCKERGCEFFNGEGGHSIDIVTNADRIRAMSDEELAEFLRWDICNKVRGDNRMCNGWCSECVTEWLKQPEEEGAT